MGDDVAATEFVKASESGTSNCVELAETGWIKASASQTGSCVEMRDEPTAVTVRDSKHPNGCVLQFTKDEFRAFLDGAKNGEFDHLVA